MKETRYDVIERINYLNEQIRQIDRFVFVAKRVWRGRLFIQKQQMLFKTIPFGFFEEEVFEMDTQTKNEILSFLQNKTDRMIKELDELIGNGDEE